VITLHSHRRPGAMLLLTVLVMGAVALAIVMSMAMRGIGEMGMAMGEARSQEAFAVSDGCLEEGMLRLALSSSFTGSTLTLGSVQCSITVTPTTGDVRTIAAIATRDRWTRKASVRVDLSGPRLQIVWWKQDL